MSRRRKESLEILGLPQSASEEDILRAYRQKARELHPDKNHGDPNATARFQKLQEAKRILIDKDEEEEKEIVIIPDFFWILLMEMERRERENFRRSREFGGFPHGPRSFIDDDDFFRRRNCENYASSRNHHTGSCSTGSRFTFGSKDHDSKEPKPQQNHAKDIQNEPPKQTQKKKSKGNWNKPKKKKRQRNTQWTSSNMNDDQIKAEDTKGDSLHYSGHDSKESSHDFHEFSEAKNGAFSKPDEEERPQENGACKTPEGGEQETHDTDTEHNSGAEETGSEEHSDNDEIERSDSYIQAEDSSSSILSESSLEEQPGIGQNTEELKKTIHDPVTPQNTNKPTQQPRHSSALIRNFKKPTYLID